MIVPSRAFPFATMVSFPLRVGAVTERTIVVSTRLSATADVFEGHFPGAPIFPGVLVLELVHLAVWTFAERLADTGPPRMRRIDSLRLTAPLFPDDEVSISADCDIDRSLSRMIVRATIHAVERGTAAATAKLEYGLGSTR